MKEIYMDIKGYEGIYQVSNLGNIRNSKGQILKPSKTNDGYRIISLYKNSKRKTYKVHRLVLSTFKPNSNNELQVNHLDENKANNNLDNLQWCTAKDNVNYGTRTERTKKKVTCIELNKTFSSIKEAAIWIGKENCDSHIIDCCKGKRKSCAGYTWKYTE